MGLWDSIKSKIFRHQDSPHQDSAVAPAPNLGTPGNSVPPRTTTTTASATPAPAPAGQPPAAPGTQHPATPQNPAAAQPVDVSAVLDKAVAGKGHKLDWRRSIVDLLKAIDVDSSLSSRKQLAHELGYTGSTDDSAAMNIWLHKAVIKKLADNGGKVPADLLD